MYTFPKSQRFLEVPFSQVESHNNGGNTDKEAVVEVFETGRGVRSL